MRTREKPHLDVETGAKAVVVINLAAQSYREGKIMYWDEKHWKASDKPDQGVTPSQQAATVREPATETQRGLPRGQPPFFLP